MSHVGRVVQSVHGGMLRSLADDGAVGHAAPQPLVHLSDPVWVGDLVAPRSMTAPARPLPMTARRGRGSRAAGTSLERGRGANVAVSTSRPRCTRADTSSASVTVQPLTRVRTTVVAHRRTSAQKPIGSGYRKPSCTAPAASGSSGHASSGSRQPGGFVVTSRSQAFSTPGESGGHPAAARWRRSTSRRPSAWAASRRGAGPSS